jgi:hypothetical protein
MTIPKQTGNETQQQLVAQVDELNEQVKGLAINLAIYLAKAKTATPAFNRLEPDFIKLINTTLKVVQELTAVINASRSEGAMLYEFPSDKATADSLELKMRSILDQCRSVLGSLTESGTGDTDMPV